MRRAPTNWPADDTIITTRQLANLLSVSPATIRRWKQAGTGPISCGRGAQTLYRCQDVKDWAVGNVRPSKHWKGRTSDPLHELDDRGRAILAAGKREMIGLRPEEREAVTKKTKRKLAARARFFAAAGTSPGEFEHQLTLAQQLVRAAQPTAHPRLIGHVNPRPPTPSNAAAQLTGSNRDRELLEALMALPKEERPSF
jgi:hypothetical protein